MMGFVEYTRRCKRCNCLFMSASKGSRICGECDDRPGDYKSLKPKKGGDFMKKEPFKDVNLTYRENNLKDAVLSVLSLNGATREETIKVCKFIMIYNQQRKGSPCHI